MAKARAKEISIIGKALTDNLQLPIKYENGNISIDSADIKDFIQRTENRFLFQEMQKQQNIENVFMLAYKNLENETPVTKDPVDPDWISCFFDSVAKVSNEQMQVLWGKVLSGEIKKPGEFSLRTLNTLKNISQSEANSFKKLSQYILECPNNFSNINSDFFLFKFVDIEAYNNISTLDISALSEAGLIATDPTFSMGFDLQSKHSVYYDGGNYSIEFENMGGAPIDINYPSYFLTKAGRELFPIVFEPMSDDHCIQYLEYCVKQIEEYVRFSAQITYCIPGNVKLKVLKRKMIP